MNESRRITTDKVGSAAADRRVQNFRRRIEAAPAAGQQRWHSEVMPDGSESRWMCIPYTAADSAVWDLIRESESGS